MSNTTYEVIVSNDINDTVENMKYLCSERFEGKKGDLDALSDLNWNLTHNYTNTGGGSSGGGGGGGSGGGSGDSEGQTCTTTYYLGFGYVTVCS